jgi:prepilin-type N-terminal cleavage/methylation domain-containing protein
MKIKYAFRGKNSQGFSLIEPLLSLMIFSLFLTIIAKIQLTIVRQLSRTHEFNTAQLKLNQLYEKEAAHSSYEQNN